MGRGVDGTWTMEPGWDWTDGVLDTPIPYKVIGPTWRPEPLVGQTGRRPKWKAACNSRPVGGRPEQLSHRAIEFILGALAADSPPKVIEQLEIAGAYLRLWRWDDKGLQDAPKSADEMGEGDEELLWIAISAVTVAAMKRLPSHSRSVAIREAEASLRTRWKRAGAQPVG
jgi:hypothetical protein